MNSPESDKPAEIVKADDKPENTAQIEAGVELRDEDLQNLSGGKTDHLVP